MPVFSPSLALYGDGVDGKLADLDDEIAAWVSELPGTVAQQSLIGYQAGVVASFTGAFSGVAGVLSEIGQSVGFYDKTANPVAQALAGALATLKSATAQFSAAMQAVLKQQIDQAAQALGAIAKDLLGNLAAFDALAGAVPVAGQVIRSAIGFVKAVSVTIRSLFGFGNSDKRPDCEIQDLRFLASTADRAAARDALALIGQRGNLTPLFSPAPGAWTTTRQQMWGPFSYAPLVGTVGAYVKPWLALGARPVLKLDGYEQRLAQYQASAWQIKSYGSPCPWLVRTSKAKAVGARGTQKWIPGWVPFSAYPKATAVMNAVWAEVTSAAPLGLCVDWSAVAENWRAFMEITLSGGQSLACDGSQTAYGDSFEASIVDKSIVLTGTDSAPTVRAFMDASGPRTGQGLLLKNGDFAEWFQERALSGQYAAERKGLGVETSAYQAFTWEWGGLRTYTPRGLGHRWYIIKYACEKLAERQAAVARTQAAAYVTPKNLQGMQPALRAIVLDTRARILAGAAAGVDVQMATRADPDFGAAVVQAKKTGFMKPTDPKSPDTAGPAPGALYGPKDATPTPGAGHGGLGAVALGALAIGGAMLYAKGAS